MLNVVFLFLPLSVSLNASSAQADITCYEQWGSKVRSKRGYHNQQRTRNAISPLSKKCRATPNITLIKTFDFTPPTDRGKPGDGRSDAAYRLSWPPAIPGPTSPEPLGRVANQAGRQGRDGH